MQQIPSNDHLSTAIYQSNDSFDTIAETTCELDRLAPRMLELLDQRSLAFARTAHYERALQDATALKVLSPLSALGYIRTGEIYASQGRQLAAIAVYDEGLKNVPRSNSQYALIEQGKANAERRNNQRIDLIAKLPMDIIMNIGRLLVTADHPILCRNNDITLLPCLQVSKTWRRCLLLCGHLHFKQWIRSHGDIFKGPDMILVPYIKSYTIKTSNRELCGMLFEASLQGETFDSLQKLSISIISSKDSSYFRYDAKFYQLRDYLRNISNTLTHLKMELISNQDEIRHLPITLEELLNICPHLLALDIAGILVDLDENTIEYPTLERLKIVSPTGPVVTEDIIWLLNKLPSLESFIIDGCRDPSTIIIMLDHRPTLRHIGFGNCIVDLDGAADEDNNEAFATHLVQVPHGKLMLELGNIVQGGDDNDMISSYTSEQLSDILERYKDILHILTFSAKCDGCPDRHIALDQLQQLAICSYSDDVDLFDTMDSFMPQWFILHARHLKKLAIRDDYLSSDALSYIERMTDIQDLEFAVRLDLGHQFPLPSTWNHFAGLGAASPLRKLTLHISSVIDGDQHILLYGISRLVTLEELSFHVGDPIDDQVFVPVIQKLGQGCPSLTHLTLSSSTILGYGIKYGALFELRYLKYLENLRLIARHIPKHAIASLLGCTDPYCVL
ncbi:hypothetical protein K492DRAFT_223205 [Lichtheimia hyalospora FSU 10163]|nr:hypothetical protein K492DRAFT_223205 [Lichtheimia hyalospora FSU 10163]